MTVIQTAHADHLAASWPADLRGVRAYLPYRFVTRTSGRLGKRPCSAHGRWVDPFDRQYHLGFGQALDVLRQGGCDGVGIVLAMEPWRAGLPLVAIDLDGVVSGGEVHPAARELVARLDSYTELSVSGTGLHVLVAGEVPLAGRRGHIKDLEVEVITCGYVAVTGLRLPGTPATLNVRSRELAELHQTLFQAPTPPVRTVAVGVLDDELVLQRARAARNGRRFAALFDRGDLSSHGDDASRGDLALLAMLRWYTLDPVQLHRLWARSALHRPERWARPAHRDGRDYATVTVARALAFSGRVRSSHKGQP
ncbi:putative DNA primase/helicase [Deinococcus metalli]|uniref:Putative DNA primase/helicase n=1 Tax=Deinococcus metalli TaxID=1141878 RepID=A0A7W8NU64_9DEIO|nr:hypothetical protein [Deinococcus metalli]MBB5378997.1 putative DNA primase/helicase [Deinococcus metalli]GHF63486.1 hypothetical protein GCM10017781_44290 [Deinococcus metalli]